MYEWIEYDNPQEQAQKLAKIVSAQIRNIFTKKPQVTLALAGGSTPALFLKKLSLQQLDWHNIRILPTDERCVDTKNERSNLGMMQNCFAANPDAAACIHPLWQEGKECTQIDKIIEKILPLDICVLGMGTDMHTASLFPKADQLETALSASSPYQVLNITQPQSGEARRTLTAKVLRACPHLHLLIKGHEKRKALKSAAEENSQLVAPIRVAFRETPPVLQVHYTNG